MKVRLPKDQNKRIASSIDVFILMQKVLKRQNKLHRQKEYFWVIGINTTSDILYVELIAIGILNKVAIDPVEVFCFAVARKCKRIILVHNHPSNNPEPSKSDIETTEEFVKGGSYLRVQIVDHIIISENEYYSFADVGFFELRKVKKIQRDKD